MVYETVRTVNSKKKKNEEEEEGEKKEKAFHPARHLSERRTYHKNVHWRTWKTEQKRSLSL